MKRLAIVCTHPVQYNVPVFQLLEKDPNIEIKVFYTFSQRQNDFFDKDFGREIKWDVPLLEGYNYEFIENTSKNPGLDHFNGIKCPSLIKAIKSWGASHILFFGWNYKAHLGAMRYFKGIIPVWFRGDSTLLDEKPGIKKIIRRVFLRWVYSHIDKAFYVGTNNKEYFKAHGLKESQLLFAPHAIDNNRFSAISNYEYESSLRRLRKGIGINNKDIVLLFVGKFEPRKNLSFLIETFKNFLNSSSNHRAQLKLILVGNGPLEDSLKKQAKGYNQIIFLPFQNQSQLPVIYRLADIFCLPSKSETWGLVVNEAMASGRPVLASNKVGSAKDLVIEGETGFLYNFDSSSDFIERINTFLTSDFKSLGNNAQVEIGKWSFFKIYAAIVKALNISSHAQ